MSNDVKAYQPLLHNKDVELLYYLCLLVQEGPGAKHLLPYFKRNPGKVTSARWITTASNILVVYLQEPNPSEILSLLVKVIVNLYGPCVFEFKKNWHVSFGSKNFFYIVQLSKELLEKDHPTLYALVLKTLKNNGYYTHPENIVVAMVHDPNVSIRNKALKLIESLRIKDEEKAESGFVRQFRVPIKINFDARHYYLLIDLKDFTYEDMSSPPLLNGYSIEDIANQNFRVDLKNLPNHSQHVERFVALTSIAAANAIGYQNRHHWILNKMKAVEMLPIGKLQPM